MTTRSSAGAGSGSGSFSGSGSGSYSGIEGSGSGSGGGSNLAPNEEKASPDGSRNTASGYHGSGGGVGGVFCSGGDAGGENADAAGVACPGDVYEDIALSAPGGVLRAATLMFDATELGGRVLAAAEAVKREGTGVGVPRWAELAEGVEFEGLSGKVRFVCRGCALYVLLLIDSVIFGLIMFFSIWLRYLLFRSVVFGLYWFGSGLFRFVWLCWVQLSQLRFSFVQICSVLVGSVRFRSVPFGSARFGLVRFGSVQFGSVRFHSVRFGSVFSSFSTKRNETERLE